MNKMLHITKFCSSFQYEQECCLVSFYEQDASHNLIYVDSNTKRFLSVLVVFGKYLVLATTENFKNSVALFWRLVREWKVQSRGLHRDFLDLARDSLASETSSRENHLVNFFSFCKNKIHSKNT